MNRHIEPGCLAVVTNSRYPENIGKTVRVIRRIGNLNDPKFIHGNDIFWEIDTPLVYWYGPFRAGKECTNIERWLMRIDGHTEPEEVDTAISNLYEEI